MENNLLNCTGHTISIFSNNGDGENERKIVEIPPLGVRVWVEDELCPVATVNGIELCRETLGNVIGLPEPKEGIFLIVDRVIYDTSERPDLVALSKFEHDKTTKRLIANALVTRGTYNRMKCSVPTNSLFVADGLITR